MDTQEIRNREASLDLLDIAYFVVGGGLCAAAVAYWGLPALTGIAGLTIGYVIAHCTKK